MIRFFSEQVSFTDFLPTSQASGIFHARFGHLAAGDVPGYELVIMPKYYTWESARSRFVFQIQVPAHAREALDGRTLVRIHLGSIPEAEAAARAQQLAAKYKAVFAKCKSVSRQSRPVTCTSGTRLLLVMEDDLPERFIATWRHRAAAEFIERMDTLRDAPDRLWEAWEDEIERNRRAALRQLRRQDRDGLHDAIREMESAFNLCLEIDRDTGKHLAREFSAARVAFLNDCLDVLNGNIPVSRLSPPPCELLPLVELWGDPATRLGEHWRESVENAQCYVNPKTWDKYRGICSDLATILARRPVQSMTRDDLEAVRQLWKSRGNAPPTIKCKTDILKALLKPFDSDERLQSLFCGIHTGAPIRSVPRLPFTDHQLAQFLAAALESESVRTDDRMLLALMLLLSSRLEEICQLRAEDFESTNEGWIVRIAGKKQTGQGKARLKNDVSARRLPLQHAAFPGLDDWLDERVNGGGYIFPDMNRDKYGNRGSAASKRLNGLIKQLFPDDQRLVLQSTRNTASRIMRRADTDLRVRRRFLGHADHGIHDKHYDPAELLDDRDLNAGSAAIAAHLRDILGVEGRPPIQR